MSTSCLHSHSQYCLFQVSPIIREETIQQARGYWFQSSTLAAGTIICRLICSPSQNISSIFKCNTYFTPSLHPGEPQSLVMRLQQRRNQVNPVLILKKKPPTYQACIHTHTHIHPYICSLIWQIYQIFFFTPFHHIADDFLSRRQKREGGWRWMCEVVMKGNINGKAGMAGRKDPSLSAVSTFRVTAQ